MGKSTKVTRRSPASFVWQTTAQPASARSMLRANQISARSTLSSSSAGRVSVGSSATAVTSNSESWPGSATASTSATNHLTQRHWDEMNRKERREMTRKIQSEDLSLEVIHPDAAGIDRFADHSFKGRRCCQFHGETCTCTDGHVTVATRQLTVRIVCLSIRRYSEFSPVTSRRDS